MPALGGPQKQKSSPARAALEDELLILPTLYISILLCCCREQENFIAVETFRLPFTSVLIMSSPEAFSVIPANLTGITERVGWVEDPNGRGTFGLVVSCFSTLLLCVYSAMHLNLPMYHESSAGYVWRYFKWALIGVLGPELVVWTAWRQYISAHALQNEIREMKAPTSGPRSSSGSCGGGDKWTMTHGFFAGMGGFVIHLNHGDDDQLPRFVPRHTQLTLTPRGIRLLAECGLLPDIDEEEILDRSKTDGLGKALACLQGVWMLLQVVQRLIVDLPVTLLEVNTLGHVFFAFIVYILWWKKPRWIKHPTILRGDWVRPIAAFMYMTSDISGHPGEGKWLLRDFGVESEMSQLAFIPSKKEDVKIDQHFLATSINVVEIDNAAHEPESPPARCYSAPMGHAHGLSHEVKSDHFIHLSDLEGHDDRPLRTLTTRTIDEDEETRPVRWRLATEAINRYPAIRKRMLPHKDTEAKRYRDAVRLYPEMPKRFRRRPEATPFPSLTRTMSTSLLDCEVEELVTAYASDWPSDELLRGMPGLIMGAVLWLASTGYGALHLAAWHSEFPTDVEKWLWRGAATYIASAGIVWIVINILSNTSKSIWWYWYDVLDGKAGKVSKMILGILCATCGTSYVLSRLYLVVEAIASLRSLSPAAYQSPSWTMSVPHL